jgi:hypothetical protein
VFYLSRRMLDAETRYPDVEKLRLCLFFTCTKLRYILQSAEMIVICKLDVIKHMLSAPVLKGRLGKWMFALSEFNIRYQPTKGNTLHARMGHVLRWIGLWRWMWHRYPACVASGATYSFSVRLPTACTNNLVEYEAVRKCMELLLD